MFKVICGECGKESEIKLVRHENKFTISNEIEIKGDIVIWGGDGYISSIHCDCGHSLVSIEHPK